MASLEAAIDDLYKRPLGEFIAGRSALAKTLAGDQRTRVARLEKPTVVPWAINQVYWRDRPVFDRVLHTGAALRQAQTTALAGGRADVRRAGDALRQALAAAVDRATR